MHIDHYYYHYLYNICNICIGSCTEDTDGLKCLHGHEGIQALGPIEFSPGKKVKVLLDPVVWLVCIFKKKCNAPGPVECVRVPWRLSGRPPNITNAPYPLAHSNVPPLPTLHKNSCKPNTSIAPRTHVQSTKHNSKNSSHIHLSLPSNTLLPPPSPAQQPHTCIPTHPRNISNSGKNCSIRHR